MSKAHPGGRVKKESLLQEFASFGGDLRLLNRLITHPAIEIIHRLHQNEVEKTEAAEALTDFYEQVNGQRRSIHRLIKTSELGLKARRWFETINRVAFGVLMEKSRYDVWKRKGIFVNYPEKYFYGAFLVPYTASITGTPKWRWIERWLTEVAHIDTQGLKQLWLKEVMKRKTWPTPTLLYALTSGAAIFLEKRGGLRASWATEWSIVNTNRPTQILNHPSKVKRALEKQDLAYLELVFKYVPLTRKNFGRVYPSTASISSASADPLVQILEREQGRKMDALPIRQKSLINKITGRQVFDVKAEGENIKKRLMAETPPRLRMYLEKKMSETLQGLRGRKSR